MRYQLVTAGTFDAITLEDARLQVKEHSNVTAEDAQILRYIRAVSRTIEHKTNRVIATSTWAGWLDGWPATCLVKVNKYPITAIDSIQYYDADNALQTMSTDDYIVDNTGNPCRIYFETLPDLYTRPGAVKINFTAGYESIELVDERIKQYARMIVADYKQVRTDYITGTIVSMLPRRAGELLSEMTMYEI